MRIETDLDGAVVAAIERHYKHAKRKHPYFCDMVSHDYWRLQDVQDNLARMRSYLQKDAERHDLDALSVLYCEVRELEEALCRGDTAAVIEETYDCIAVLLRVIDVLEGRQALGRPKEGAK